MANTNTFQGFYNSPALALATSSETVLPYWAAQGVGPGTTPVYAAGAAAVLQLRPDVTGGVGLQDGRGFKVRLAGKYTSGGAANLTVKMYFVPSTATFVQAATPGNNTAFGTPISAVAAGTASGNFVIDYHLIWDAASGRLGGYFDGTYNLNTAVAYIAATATPQVTGLTTESLLQFVPSFQFSAANAGTTVTVTEFVVEQQ